MNTIELLDALQLKAKKDPELRKALFATRSEKNPVDAFCKKCQEEGYPIYTMDLIQQGKSFMLPCVAVPTVGEKIRQNWKAKTIFMNYFSPLWKIENMI